MKKRALFAIMILSLLFLALLSLSATASAATHTVTFETSGLLNIPSQQVEDGGYATKPSGVNPDDKINEEKSLYFYRWYSVAPSASFTEADLSGKVFDFSKTKITKDTTIYAGYSGTMYIYIYDISNNRGEYGGRIRYSSPYNSKDEFVGNSGTTCVVGTVMTVEAKPNDGYRFVGWSTTTSSEDIVSSASIYSFTYQQKATIYALFETGTPDPISNMSATFTLPEAGTSADKPPVVTVPSGKHYEYYRDASVWFDESASSFLPDTTVFKAGETYCAGLVFLAKDGYAFTDNATVSFTNDSITYEQPMTDSNSLAVIIKFTVPASSDPDPSGQQQDEQQQQPADQPSQQQEQPQQQQEEPPAGQQQPPQEEQPQTESQPGQQEQQEQQEQQSDERIAFSKLKKVKVKAVSKKKIKVSWKKLSKKVRKEVKKIQIQVSTDHDFQNIVKTKLVSSKKTSCTISGLKKKTKYFIRIRAYTEKDGLKYVSEWVMKIKKTKK